MLLPVVLIFSFIVISGIHTYIGAHAQIDIEERELAKRFIADYQAVTCLRQVGESFVHDPYMYFENGMKVNFWPTVAGDSNMHRRVCEVELSREIGSSSEDEVESPDVLDSGLDGTENLYIIARIIVREPYLRTYSGTIYFKDSEIHEIFMRN